MRAENPELKGCAPRAEGGDHPQPNGPQRQPLHHQTPGADRAKGRAGPHRGLEVRGDRETSQTPTSPRSPPWTPMPRRGSTRRNPPRTPAKADTSKLIPKPAGAEAVRQARRQGPQDPAKSGRRSRQECRRRRLPARRDRALRARPARDRGAQNETRSGTESAGSFEPAGKWPESEFRPLGLTSYLSRITDTG